MIERHGDEFTGCVLINPLQSFRVFVFTGGVGEYSMQGREEKAGDQKADFQALLCTSDSGHEL